jgi:tRNA(Leu) C34 or U34 (ribose-2'-O)-methylase TrmL
MRLRHMGRRPASAAADGGADSPRRRPRQPSPPSRPSPLDVSDVVSARASGGRGWPRPLKGALGDTRTLAAERLSPAAVAGRASRFPLTGRFMLDDGSSMDAARLMSLVSPFVSADRAARFRAVAAARRFDVLPIVEGLYDRGNLGAVCRTADALGVGAVHAVDLAAGAYRPSRGRCSAGGEKWLDVWTHADPGACVAAAKAAGFRVAVAAAGPGAVAAHELDWEVPTAFIVGNEAEGVSGEGGRGEGGRGEALVPPADAANPSPPRPAASRAAADVEVQIPMTGMVESLNVSVAAALLMQAALARIAAVGAPGLDAAEADTMAALMLARHKAQQGRAGQAWQAPMLRELAAREG